MSRFRSVQDHCNDKRRRTAKRGGPWSRRRLLIESLEDRNLLAGLSAVSSEAAVSVQESFAMASDFNGGPLTIILDFNDGSQASTTDSLGNVVSTWDTDGRFTPRQSMIDGVLDQVRSTFDLETNDQFSLSPLLPGYDLDIEFEVGNIGTPPQNGSSDYFYIQIGDKVHFANGGTDLYGRFGASERSSIRQSNGNSNAIAGTVLGSVFIDSIADVRCTWLEGCRWTNAEAIHAIGNETAHQIGHSLSLYNISASAAVTPTGKAPIMSNDTTGAEYYESALEFAYSGKNLTEFYRTEYPMRQLANAVGVVDTDTNDSITDFLVYASMDGVNIGGVGHSADVTMYAVIISQPGQMVGFDLDRSSTSSLDSALRLFDSSGNQLAKNDNGLGPTPEQSSADSYLEYKFQSAGTYYIGVSSSGNTAYSATTGLGDVDGGSSGLFTLKTTNLGVDTDGATLSTATPLSITGVPSTGHLKAGTDVDFYSFSATAGQVVFLQALHTSGTAVPAMTVFDSAGFSTGFNGQTDLTFIAPSTGTFYLGIRDSSAIFTPFLGIATNHLYRTPSNYQLKLADSFLIEVTQLNDEDDGNRTAGDISLREAILMANAVDYSEIVFDPALFSVPRTIQIGTTTGYEITSPTTITGPGSNLLTLKAGPGFADSVLQFQNPYFFSDEVMVLSGITVTGGNSTFGGANGGGIDHKSGELRLEDVVLIGNNASQGGGIFSRGKLTIENSRIHGNTSNVGGGLNVSSARGQTTIRNTTISNNVANEGGGVYVIGFAADVGELEIVDSEIIDNTAVDGAGIWFSSAAADGITITNSTIARNNASDDGAGLLVANGDISMTQSTISGNDAIDDGGALFITGGSASFYSSTITQNSASASGGIHRSGTGAVQVGSSLLAGNFSNGVIGGDSTSTLVQSLGYNIVGGVAGATFNQLGDQRGFVNLGLGPLAENGGPTLSHALMPGSPAINAGDPDQSGFDQRGIPFERSFDGFADAGAYERRVFPASYFVVNTLTDEFDYSNSFVSLREAIHTANGNFGSDTITFAIGLHGTIDISSQLPTITEGVTITGLGADVLTIDARGGGDDVLDGDGFRIFEVTDLASTLINVSISGLTLTGGDVIGSGGAISSSENLTLDRMAIVANRAKFGGGLSGRATITNSTISDNFAGQNGGGISGSVIANNVTISGNTAADHGGGIVTGGTTSSIVLENSTVTGNTAQSNSAASGVWFFNSYGAGTGSINNSIIDGGLLNAAPMVPLTGSNNIFAGSVTIAGSNNFQSTDPLLGPLADNEGPTRTHALREGSPAINAGSSTQTYDQRGAPFLRDDGNGVDIGAYEAQSLPPSYFVVTTLADELDFDNSEVSLREAIDRAHVSLGHDTITFASGLTGTIEINSQLPTITDDLTITGPGANLLTIDAGDGSLTANGFRIFNIDDGTADFIDVTISDLTMTGGDVAGSGGAISNAENLTLVRSTLTGNASSDRGGGLYNTGSLTVSNSTIHDNRGYGGGIHSLNNSATATTVTISNSTISGNTSISSGGGIRSVGDSATVTIESSTFTDNTATRGGGVDVVSAPLAINNSIVAGNTAPLHPDITTITGTSGTFNLIGIGTGLTDLSDGVGGNQIGTAAVPRNPLLGPLTDNGGQTMTHTLEVGSPAIDAGSLAQLFDQRGVPRPIDDPNASGSGSDIGAVEVELVTPTVLSVDTNLSLIYDGNVGLDAFEVTVVFSEPMDSNVTPDLAFTPAVDAVLANGTGVWSNGDNTFTMTYDVIDTQVNIANVTIDVTGARDVAANALADYTSQIEFSVDTLNPLVLIEFADGFVASGESTVINFTVSESTNDFDVNDLTAIGGTISNFSGNGETYSATFTYDVGLEGTVSIEVADGSVSDAHGNVSTTASRTIEILPARGLIVDTTSSARDGIYALNELSLSEAVYLANLSAGPDTITFGSLFDSQQTIFVAGGDLSITETLTIIGPGQRLLTLDALSNGRVLDFPVAAGDLTLSGLTLNRGRLLGNNTTPTDTTFSGAGVRFSSSGDLTLINSTVAYSDAQGDLTEGGGIHSASGNVFLIGSTVRNNFVTDSSGSITRGGGIFTNTGSLSLVSSTLYNNSAHSGGGIYAMSGSIDLIDSTVSSNSTWGGSTTFRGGGIATDSSSIAIFSSTITNNSSEIAGGIHVADTDSNPSFVVENSIIQGNTSNFDPIDLQHDPDSPLTIDYSLIGRTNFTSINDSTGTGNRLNVSAQLGPLADNGGPTLTHALDAGSPAIDAGDPAITFDAADFDQRRYPFVRVFDGDASSGARIDMGALEVQTLPTLVVDSLVDIDDDDYSAGELTLREAVFLANIAPDSDTITFGSLFDTAQSIDLTAGELRIYASLAIIGPGQDLLTIDAQGASRVVNFSSFNGDLSISGLTLTGGQATGNGGGIFSSGNLALTDSTVSDNTTTSAGGGIYTINSTLNLISSTVSGNSITGSGAHGGGIFARGGQVNLTSSTISGNSITGTGNLFGGGVYTTSGSVTLTDSTVSGNQANKFANSFGGGIATLSGSLTAIGSTISENQARFAGGIWIGNSSPVTIYNSIIAANSSTDAELSLGSGTRTIDYSLISFSAGTFGIGNLSFQDPMLGPLADNGGPTQTHALLLGSPAFNAGDPAITFDAAEFDQRGSGFSRVKLGQIDIGAFESGGYDFGDAPSPYPTLLVNHGAGHEAIGPALGSLRDTEDDGQADDGADEDGVTFDAGTILVGATDATVTVNVQGGPAKLDAWINFSGGGTWSTSEQVFDSVDVVDGDNVLTFSVPATAIGGLTWARFRLSTAGNLSPGGFASDGEVEDYPVTIIDLAPPSVAQFAAYHITRSGGNTYAVPTKSLPISDADVGADKEILVSIVFSEAMDQSMIPVLTFDKDVTSTLVNAHGYWETNRRFNVFYDVLDANIRIDDVAIDVTGATDVFANAQLDYTPEIEFSIDTLNPSVTVEIAADALDSGGASLVSFTVSETTTDFVVGDIATIGGTISGFVFNDPIYSAIFTPNVGFEGTARVTAVAGSFSDAVGNFAAEAFDTIEVLPSRGLIVDTSSDVVDGDYSPNELSLREAVLLANLVPDDVITFDPTVFTGGANSLIRLTQGELLITAGLTIDGSLGTEIVITADASSNDVLVPGTYVTDVAASLAANASSLDDNSRVVNFSAATGDLTLVGLTVTGGRTTGANDIGGGIRFDSMDGLTLTSSTVSGNSTTGELGLGGGIYAFGDATLDSSTLSGNRTYGDEGIGGGIFARHGDVSLTSSTISGNSTSGDFADGGGIAARYGDITLMESTISGNRGSDGGGIFMFRGGLSLSHSTISGNVAEERGGGVFVINYGYNPPLTIESSIVAGNTDNGSGPDLHPDPDSTLTINHSLIGISALTITGNNNQIGSVATPVEPLLGALANNGGPTQTHALLPGSPAINAGDPGFGSPPNFDQRGFARVAGGRIDMGAFESQETPSLTVTTPNDIIDENDQVTSLREAIRFANALPGSQTITFDANVFLGDPNSLIRLTQGELEITDTLAIDGTTGLDVTISGDALGDDALVPGTLITDVAASVNLQLDDNSRVLNFSSTTGDLTVNGLTVTGGRTNDNGGGIRFNSDGVLSLTGSTISGNSASYGGGIHNKGTVTVTSSVLSGNSANVGGGGIWNHGTANVTSSTLSGNSAGRGGGFYNTYIGTATISSSTLSGNSVDGDGGGGIFGGGTVAVTSSTLSGNSANNGYGGGIYSFSGTVTVTNSTLSGNSAYIGGGIRKFSGTVTVNNSIVAGSTSGGDVVGSLSGAFNLIQDGSGGLVDTIGGNPLLGPLADNGGPTLTHAISPVSPAFNAGDPAIPFNVGEFDQRGSTPFSRVLLGRIDIGAFESSGFDFGDAPDSYGTLLASDGARHDAVGPTLGATRDGESDAVAPLDGSGDGADDDGVIFGTIQVGQLDASVTVNVQGAAGQLDAWIDFNGDGTFDGLGERIANSALVNVGDNVVLFDVPADAVSGQTLYARIRLSTAGGLGPRGLALDGEVEDHTLTINPPDFSRVFADSGQTLANRSSSQSVSLGDIDGDGDLDAFVANYRGDHEVWTNTGGVFTNSGQTLANSSNSQSVSLGDFDGDGDLDAFVANFQGDHQVWTNAGGLFTNSQTLANSSFSQSVSLGDLDGDGDLDAFVANLVSNHQVWTNNGGIFTNSAQALANSSGSYSASLGDVDGDGDLDAFVANSGGDHQVWTNTNGVFTNSQTLANSSFSFSVSLGDLDDDGDLDAFVANYQGDHQVWTNTGGVFAGSQTLANSSISFSVSLGDVDGDGDLDAFVANNSGDHQVWANTGGMFTDSGQTLPNSSDSQSVSLGDFDGDGDLDAFIANGYGDHQVFINVNPDFGDAPDSYGTLLASDGARHEAVGPTLGATRDSESDAVAPLDGSGDGADDDGVVFGTIQVGTAIAGVNIDLQNAASARVDAWIDFDGNGVWDASDQILDNVFVSGGLQTLNFVVPANAVVGDTYARVRVSSAGGLGPHGPALDGEVEDYLVTITKNVVFNLPTGVSNDVNLQLNGANVEVTDNNNGGVVLFTTPLSSTQSLTINGGTLNDNVNIDFNATTAGGFFSFVGGIAFNGSNGIDKLVVNGTGTSRATYHSNNSTLGDASITTRDGANTSVVTFTEVEPLAVTGMLTFAVDGTLNVGADTLTIESTLMAALDDLTLLDGGTITSASGLALGSGESLIGNGTIDGPFAGQSGSTVLLTGNLTIGDAAAFNGFDTDGILRIANHTLTLLDANQAVLGSLTTLGSGGNAGTITAANGALIDFGNNLTGFGTLDTANDIALMSLINGSVDGNSLAQPITLPGYYKGVGSLNNVNITGTHSPGFSPAQVVNGSVSYAASADIVLELGGTTPGSSGYDQLIHTGAVNLGGDLKVNQINGFTPTVGDSFLLMTSDVGFTGDFDNVELPVAPLGSDWDVTITAGEVRLTLVDLAQVGAVILGDGLQHSVITKIDVRFEGLVDIDENAFQLIRRDVDGGAVANSFTTVVDAQGNTVATIVFGTTPDLTRGLKNALADGNYQLTIDPSKVRRAGTSVRLDGNEDGLQGGAHVMGADASDDFFAMFGDTSGDRTVGIGEFGQLRLALTKIDPDPAFNEQFDYDGDGVVGIGDFGQFRLRLTKRIDFE